MSAAEQSARPKKTRAGSFDKDTVSVGTSATKLCDRNPNRKQIILVNQGTSDVKADMTQQVTTSTGHFLTSDGGQIIVLKAEDEDMVKQEWWGISAVASQNVEVTEVFEK